MGKISDLIKRLSAFDPGKVLSNVLDTAENEQFIAERVRKRLNERGEDSEGRKLYTDRAKRPAVYSAFTMAMKQMRGQPTDHVTLKDTGSFHKSFELQMLKEAFQITGDSQKPDGDISENVDLTNVLNLSRSEKNEVVDKIKPDYIRATREAVRL